MTLITSYNPWCASLLPPPVRGAAKGGVMTTENYRGTTMGEHSNNTCMCSSMTIVLSYPTPSRGKQFRKREL